jgi:hypothetical protein
MCAGSLKMTSVTYLSDPANRTTKSILDMSPLQRRQHAGSVRTQGEGAFWLELFIRLSRGLRNGGEVARSLEFDLKELPLADLY